MLLKRLAYLSEQPRQRDLLIVKREHSIIGIVSHVADIDVEALGTTAGVECGQSMGNRVDMDDLVKDRDMCERLG